MKTFLFLKAHLKVLILAGSFFTILGVAPMNVYDNTSSTSRVREVQTVNAPFELRINSGGPKITYGNEVFEKDNYYGGNGKNFSNNAIKDIANTDRDALYKTERSTLLGKSTFNYAIPVPDGKYTVKLHFAEIYWGARGGEAGDPGDRVFDVSIENKKMINDLDLYKEVGSMVALIKTFTVTVTDGKMNLDFSASKDQPKLSALEISQIDETNDQDAVYINAGGAEVKVGSKIFSADKFYKNGRKFSNTKIKDVKNTTADALYTSERSTGVNKGKFSYQIPVKGGQYEVKLHFSELWWGATGGLNPGSNQRRFSVNLEGKSIIKDLDLVKEYGSMTAVVKTYVTNVSDGMLNIDFSASLDEPKVSAIEVIKITQQNPDDAVALINSGGGSVNYGGKIYMADKYYNNGSLDYEQSGRSIANTEEDAIYRSERISRTDKGILSYAIPVAKGSYSVELQFAEIYWKENGKRLMDVSIEGDKVINDLDIFKTAGANTALIETFNTNVSDGVLNIELSASIDRPKLSAISVYASDGTPAEDLPLMLRLNTGGPAITSNGVDFEKDSYFSSGTQANQVNLSDIKNTETDGAYMSERSADSNHGAFSYNFPISNGEYKVKLHFAEIWFGIPGGGAAGKGKRIFDVDIENKKVIDNLDLTKEVGGQTALVKSFMVNVSDGKLNIDFSASTDRPTISAIEIFGNGEIGTDADPCHWNYLASSPIKKAEAQSAKVNGKLYVLAGFTKGNGLQILNNTDIYDPANDVWSKGTPMPTPVTHMGIAVVDDDIWIVAGFTGNDPGVATDKVQIYNTTTDTWRNGPSIPAPRGSGAAVYNKGKIHFFGGLLPDRMTDVDEHYVLDLDNLSRGWKPAAKLPHARNHLGGASVNGLVYAIGGQYGHDNVEPDDQKWLEAYNPATDTWTRMADLPSDRSHFEPGTIVHNGKIIIVGGRRGWFYFFNDITEYDPATNTWTERCKLPNRNMAAAAKVFGDKLIVANGGIDGETHPTDEVKWIPIEPENNQSIAAAKTAVAPQENAASGLKLYPNPSEGNITLQIDDAKSKEKVTLVVKNMAGLLMIENKVIASAGQNTFQLATAELRRGIYFVEMTRESGVKEVVRFVKM